jgi:hypothetical protein
MKHWNSKRLVFGLGLVSALVVVSLTVVACASTANLPASNHEAKTVLVKAATNQPVATTIPIMWRKGIKFDQEAPVRTARIGEDTPVSTNDEGLLTPTGLPIIAAGTKVKIRGGGYSWNQSRGQMNYVIIDYPNRGYVFADSVVLDVHESPSFDSPVIETITYRGRTDWYLDTKTKDGWVQLFYPDEGGWIYTK